MSKAFRLRENTPMFYRYSYINREGRIEIGSAITKLIRTVLMSVNTFIAVMGSLVGLALGMGLGYMGNPFLGGLVFALMILGAWLQSTAFEYGRVYGLWRGSCPHCDEPLRIVARKAETRTVSCPMCTHRVMLDNGLYRRALWYA